VENLEETFAKLLPLPALIEALDGEPKPRV